MSTPTVPFSHLLRLSDDVGLLEHCDGIAPRLDHGYCVDDVARGLVVACREPAPGPDLLRLAWLYLGFLAQAQAPDGRFRNRLGYDRRWRGEPGTEDCWGRALWGLGTATARGPSAEIRAQARAHFDRGARVTSPWPHAMAFAALGAAEVLGCSPDDARALALLSEAADVIGRPAAGGQWPWPAPRLTYANAAMAEAVIVAGWRLGRGPVLRAGLDMLGWLLAAETRDGHFSVVPTIGWGPGEPRPAFDQQPIEVAALADACLRAAAVTGQENWLEGVNMAVQWFLGDNDSQVPMLDEKTGGGFDGLRRAGRNHNQGAESTLAMISVMQQGRHVAVRAR